MPDRGFDVGIAEGHAVTFSGGMAKDGLIPFCNIYSSFMQRAYDNIIHDVAIHKQHVVTKSRTVPWTERRFQMIIKSAKGRIFLGRTNGCRTAS